MIHVRTQIRTAAAATLTGLATTGEKVFKSRMRPSEDDELPCLLVYCDDEPNIARQTAGKTPRLSRELLLVVKGLAKNGAGLDDELDAICLEVEKAISTNLTLGGLVRDGVWLTSINTTINEEMETTCGEIIMTFSATYSTNSNTPETAL
jgi:hypothetical protein